MKTTDTIIVDKKTGNLNGSELWFSEGEIKEAIEQIEERERVDEEEVYISATELKMRLGVGQK